MDSLTPSDLFSPSKARQQRARAQDWAHIESWLSYKYAGRTMPAFERNEETLKVLRELSMANERADEERAVLERVEREALKELDEVTTNPNGAHILSTLRANLTPEGSTALAALASTTIALSTPTADPQTLAHALISYTATTQNLTNQLTHIQDLQKYLSKQHALLRAQLHELQTDPLFSAPASLQRQTIEQTRQTKHLRSKIREAESQLSSLQSSHARAMTPGSKNIATVEAITDMLEQQRASEELRERVQALEEEVEQFGGLPADLTAARKEVGRLEVRCDEVRRRRDELFEELVG
ncbi:uncharacterized protein M421DRAFT_420173 [Didymella exigua CBS 183.55]|uniref:HAUS augmin-like complex subunit 1 n=1 Tax=Didymella exigua CBS 183.55 TaxID=1150837 RepID=A0A6A5RPH5_9PLEO|nr:uncharacterized protein M421DRAFT_420173 [Didymella exigua CBS 183.55]KAF1928944.1 hypothetical protein M421DRAFT_420173 [Didymella exigua CBS 183.55]